jgi:hypothetical protein
LNHSPGDGLGRRLFKESQRLASRASRPSRHYRGLGDDGPSPRHSPKDRAMDEARPMKYRRARPGACDAAQDAAVTWRVAAIIMGARWRTEAGALAHLGNDDSTEVVSSLSRRWPRSDGDAL